MDFYFVNTLSKESLRNLCSSCKICATMLLRHTAQPRHTTGTPRTDYKPFYSPYLYTGSHLVRKSLVGDIIRSGLDCSRFVAYSEQTLVVCVGMLNITHSSAIMLELIFYERVDIMSFTVDWIPCSEYLPRHNTEVLVWRANPWDRFVEGHAQVTTFRLTCGGPEWDCDQCSFWENLFRRYVTHWMPLPTDPSKGKP